MLWKNILSKLKIFIFGFILLTHFATFITCNKTNIQCDNILSLMQTDDELKETFSQNISSIIESNDYSKCIDSLLNTGNYSTAIFFLEELSRRKIKFRDNLKKTVSLIDNKMKDLYNKYRFTEEEFQKVIPVIQWAQSLNNVYIQLKFSHRHDSPGCPEVKNLQVDLEPRTLYLSAYCIQGDIPIKFELKLPFFVEVSVEDSKHSEDSNGRYVFTLPKAKGGMYWDRLVPSQEDYPKHTKIWMDMHEKFKSEIENFIKDDEEEEYQKLLEEIGKKKKKGRKKKVTFN